MLIKLMRTLLILVCASLLSGCGALLVGGAATTATVATDRRSTGEQVDDKTIELSSANEMEKAFGKNGRVVSTSYAGRLLLVGDVATQADKQKAEKIAAGISRVKKVENFIRVGDITPLSVRSNDTWITSKVKSKLISTKEVPFRTIKVTTERGIVYLMGKVTAQEGQRAAKAAATINSVNKVVKLFNVVSAADIIGDDQKSNLSSSTTDNSSKSSDSEPESDGAQAMPVK